MSTTRETWIVVRFSPGAYRVLSRHRTEKAAIVAWRRAYKGDPFVNHGWYRESELATHERFADRERIED